MLKDINIYFEWFLAVIYVCSNQIFDTIHNVFFPQIQENFGFDQLGKTHIAVDIYYVNQLTRVRMFNVWQINVSIVQHDRYNNMTNEI